MSEAVSIKRLSLEELPMMLAWAGEEGWGPGADDAAPFHAADPHGFLCLFKGDEPISVISSIRYGNDFGFLGFYICKPEFRGQGHGLRIWNEAMAHLDGRTIGLDGVVEQQENYAKSGFELAHRNIRFGGISNVATPIDSRISQIGTGIMDSIVEYDRPFFAEDREAFVRLWNAPMNRQRYGFYAIENGSIKGYGTIRASDIGYKIGPLFADTEEIADLLFRTLAGTVRGQNIFLDLPETNPLAERLAERYELSPVFETARMYKGSAPKLPLDRIYGVTTFELG
ncbi:GNAT family N-acetyltransferase [Rhodobacteraceae bacterium RKSG542]|uniref:GNAT family N-acetyltransferase n=1 Tax=Pseudovibrio flavus TaxID=2529854 RepID=UPI0012BB6BF2|nr:GNAT family N-acetyltransferase [Pseudovibrio flavus]MTI18547.1 GNAT family N-acetyltransferase [Pseudovibrio flavus]